MLPYSFILFTAFLLCDKQSGKLILQSCVVKEKGQQEASTSTIATPGKMLNTHSDAQNSGTKPELGFSWNIRAAGRVEQGRAEQGRALVTGCAH